MLVAAASEVELLRVGVRIGVIGVGVAPGVVSAGASYKRGQQVSSGNGAFTRRLGFLRLARAPARPSLQARQQSKKARCRQEMRRPGKKRLYQRTR